uniref:Putative glycosyltransferase n=1 Tax=viral metagenome TaxID=1070528 RepID=A0A6H1ZPT8_9ZZZZ
MDYRIAVPAGIGDVSWIWSKLSTLKNDTFTIYTPQTWPMRTYEWLRLLPRVTPMIGKFEYNTILTWENLHNYSKYDQSWKSIVDSYGEEEVIYLQPNQHFLAGKPLSEWIPDLDIDFHYPIYVTAGEEANGLSLLRIHGGGKYNLGIHMACLRGVEAWNAWRPESWAKFITLVKKEFPELKIVLLGGNWDLDMALQLKELMPEEEFVDLIGRTTIGEVLSILKELSYYVGYSSGLNVMCNVLRTPCTALWPDWQLPHIYPHADPEMVRDRTYMGFVYDDPEIIFNRVKDSIRTAMEVSDGR